MKPIEFEQSNIMVAKDQEQYETLPAHLDPNGVLTSCWELTPIEAEIVRNTGKIYLQQFIGLLPVQPISLTVENPLNQ